ncbi:MAG: cation:proton antiporter [Janthinobacterium lividum]
MTSEIWLLIFCTFGLLVALGATSGIINQLLWVSEPLACVVAGIALGPLGAGLLQLDPVAHPVDADILREAARFTLAIAVTGAAMRLPVHWLSRNWRGMAVALGPGMVLMWLAGSAIGFLLFGLPLLTALLLGAAIAPTDPVLSAPILTGRLAQHAVPAPLRDGMTAESAVNDGLALPLVMLPILLMKHAPAEAGREWLLHVLVWEIVGAVLVGAAAGWGTAQALRWARSRPDVDGASLLTVTISLALATTAGVRLLGGDEILAAFVAGVVLNNSNRQFNVEEHHERFSEALGRFFDLPVMILFGAAIPWAAWGQLGWRGVAFAVAVLLLRRIPAWLLLRRWLPWNRDARSALFAGWFGPIGAAALFYATLIQDETGSTALWPFITLAIGASVLVHGITSTPFTRLFGGTPPPNRPDEERRHVG